MSYKDVLVLIDPSDTGWTVAGCAAALAAEHQAHLTALYLQHDPLIGFAETQLTPEIIRIHQENLERTEQDARSHFEEACGAAGVVGEWRSAPEARMSALMLSTRYVDLVAMRSTASSAADLVMHRYADHVIIAAGRPVLLYPESYEHKKSFKRIMVAWDGSKEATRAVHDAMPLLTGADKVVVMEVADKYEVVTRDPASDIARHLARHGVETESKHSVKSDISVGDELLSTAADQGIDLLVAGAYGHSRLREFALGGVTRHLVMHLTIPMLFSH